MLSRCAAQPSRRLRGVPPDPHAQALPATLTPCDLDHFDHDHHDNFTARRPCS